MASSGPTAKVRALRRCAALVSFEAMVGDVEAVRVALGLGKINVLGHSFGGVLAQAYAFAHQGNISHLVLCSTFHSTKALNESFPA